jgi:hypothetical protein
MNPDRRRFRTSSALVFIAASAMISPGARASQESLAGHQESGVVLSANAEQVANVIGVLPLVQRLGALRSGSKPAGDTSVEELSLRQQITEAVLTASLDLEGVLAEIDFERAQILEVRQQLSGKKDQRVNVLTLSSIIIGTGSGFVGTSMQFSGPLAKTGDWIQAVGGAGGVALSILALRPTGGKGLLGTAPNMLAPLFGRTPELRSEYPSDVWTYLNTAPANDPRVHVPWKDNLISEWVSLGKIGPPAAPGSQAKIDQLTSRIADQKRLSADLLADRSTMLIDLRSRLSLMTRDLRDLMRATSVAPAH